MNGFNRVPSLGRLTKYLGISIDQAKAVRGILKGKISPDEYQSVQDWVKQCYNPPHWLDCALTAINEILGTYGIESIDGDRFVSHYWQTCAALYLNTGESYQTTLLYNTQTGTISLDSWADFVERHRL